MLTTSRCYIRHCKHYLGIRQPDGTERTERNYCEAFADKIPDDISYGENEHLKSVKDQDNEIVFEKGEFVWERKGYQPSMVKLGI